MVGVTTPYTFKTTAAVDTSADKALLFAALTTDTATKIIMSNRSCKSIVPAFVRSKDLIPEIYEPVFLEEQTTLKYRGMPVEALAPFEEFSEDEYPIRSHFKSTGRLVGFVHSNQPIQTMSSRSIVLICVIIMGSITVPFNAAPGTPFYVNNKQVGVFIADQRVCIDSIF